MENGKFSLVSFDGMSEVFKLLINKISDAVGWIAVEGNPKQIAKQVYIEEIKKSDLSPLEKAAAISNAKKTIKQYINQSKTIKMAADYMSDTVNPNDLDDDWISYWMDKVRLISNEQFQLIWAKLLASELEEPGRYTLRFMRFLSELNHSDAELFQKVAGLIMFSDDQNAFIFDYADYISHLEFLRLCEIGVLNDTESELSVITSVNDPKAIYNSSYSLVVISTTDYSKPLRLHVHKVTDNGLQLLKLTAQQVNDTWIFEAAKRVKKNNLDKQIRLYRSNCIGENYLQTDDNDILADL